MVVEINLSKTGKHAGKYVAIVDDIDADLDSFNWRVMPHGKTNYASRHVLREEGRNKYVFLHRAIMEKQLGYPIPDGVQVDHISGDGLDCRRENLRMATNAQNQANRVLSSKNKSGYKGVSWYKKTQKWHAQIAYNGKVVHLGYFTTPELAHAAYCEAAKKYHGEFANFGEVQS